MIISAVERQRRRKRVNVFVDGEFALAVGEALAAEQGVYAGRTITPGELGALRAEEQRRQAYESAVRLLAYRPRSEQELRDRLLRKGLGRNAADHAIEKLRSLGYLDDRAFAKFWAETRQAFRPRSRRLMAGELRRKGIDQTAVAEAVEPISDEAAAYVAAARRARGLAKLEYKRFRERLGAFLTRRGFSYDVARRTIDRAWEEIREGQEPGGRG